MIGLGVLAWVVVVAVGSSVVWGVVSRVGRDAAPASAPLAAAPSSVPPSTTSAPSGGSPSARPSARPSRRPSSRPAGSPSSRPATSAPAATSPSGPPAPSSVQRTWSGAAGVVVASCRGTTISLVRAVPSADGYRVDVTDRGPQRLRVEFEGREEQEGSDTRVEAVCVDGAPRFSARSEGSED